MRLNIPPHTVYVLDVRFAEITSCQVSSRFGACQNKPPRIFATWMEIAARRSKIRAHRKEDDGTRVHVETFVRCMHASGVTNGLGVASNIKN